MWGCQRNSVSPDGSWARSLWLQVGVGDGVEQRVNKVLSTGPLLPSWGLSFNTRGHSSRILGSQASVSRGPLIPIWLSLNFGLLPYYIRLLLSYSPFYHGLLSSGSPTIDSTGLVLTPWFQGQEAWCKGPLVTGRAVAWRRLGEGLSTQAGCRLGEAEGMLSEARSPKYPVRKCSWSRCWWWQKGMAGFTENILDWLQIHQRSNYKPLIFLNKNK